MFPTSNDSPCNSSILLWCKTLSMEATGQILPVDLPRLAPCPSQGPRQEGHSPRHRKVWEGAVLLSRGTRTSALRSAARKDVSSSRVDGLYPAPALQPWARLPGCWGQDFTGLVSNACPATLNEQDPALSKQMSTSREKEC